MNKIKELRLEYELTQDQVAKAIGTSQRNIGRWESNEREMGAHFAVQLAHFFNVSIEYLLGLTSDEELQTSISYSTPILTNDEKELVETFRRMTKETQAITLDTVHSLAGDNERGKSVLNKRA